MKGVCLVRTPMMYNECGAGKDNGGQDYSLKGPSVDKFFYACNSLGTIAFAYNTVILPEIAVRLAALACTDICTRAHAIFMMLSPLLSIGVRSHCDGIIILKGD